MSLTLYFDAISQPSRSVMIFLAAAKIPHVKKFINLGKGEHMTNTEFMKVSPQNKVPAIKHGDFCLTESGAILQYLHATFKCPDHWYPQDLKLRAKINEYLAWHHTNTRIGMAMTFRTEVLKPRMTGKLPDPKSLARYVKLATSSVKTIEDYFLADSKFIMSNEISFADLLAVTEFSQLDMIGKEYFQKTARISTWLADCREALNPHYDEAHQMCHRLAKILREQSNL